LPRYQLWLSSGVDLVVTTRDPLLLQALPNVISTTEGHQIRDEAILALRLVPDEAAERRAPAAQTPTR
jgi:hypothetical protein